MLFNSCHIFSPSSTQYPTYPSSSQYPQILSVAPIGSQLTPVFSGCTKFPFLQFRQFHAIPLVLLVSPVLPIHFNAPKFFLPVTPVLPVLSQFLPVPPVLPVHPVLPVLSVSPSTPSSPIFLQFPKCIGRFKCNVVFLGVP